MDGARPDEFEQLRYGLQLACRPAYLMEVLRGRTILERLPPAWVRDHLEATAESVLDLNDPFQFARLLEACETVDAELLGRFLLRGLGHPAEEIRRVASDWREG